VALNLDLQSLIFPKKVRHLLQHGVRSRFERGFVEIEQYAVKRDVARLLEIRG